MTYVRLAPTSTGSNSGSITGASVHAALSDNSDSTFVTYDYGEASLLGFADLTLPSGAQLVFAQLMARCAKNGAAAARLDTNLNVDGNQSAQTAVTGTLPAEMGGAARGYGAITDAGVDAAIGGISCGSLSQLIVYEASIRVLYYVKPTVTVTAPTGTVTTNEVTVEWSSVFDPDAVGPYSYEVKIFSAAQYGAGGFNPSSSTPTLFTSFASGQSSVLFANSSLADGNYRAYVRVAAANATDLWSDWDYEAFTVDAPNPGVPTLTVTGENSNGRVKLEVDDTSGDTGTNYFHVQRSVGDESYEGFVAGLDCSLLLPLGAADGLIDASGNGRNGTAVGGVTVGGVAGPLMVGDEGATNFDGTDDRITTTYATRRNLNTNPNLETNATGWSSFASRATCARVSTQAYDGTYSYEAICPGTITAEGTVITGAAGLTPSVTYSARVWVKAPLGATMRMSVQEYTTAVGYVGETTVNFTGTGAWQEVTQSRAFGATGTRCFVSVLTATTAQAITFYTDCCLVEQAAAAGVYFPTTAQLASGEAGWNGTANASASDIGCFANGTSRTFMGWAWRDTSSSADTLLGGSAASVMVRLDSGGNDLSFFPSSAAAGSTWTSAWPGNGEWVHWALTFNEATDTANLYINGEFVAAKTNAVQFPADAANLQIAARTTEFFDGKQAWVSVHSRALTALEIQGAFVSADGSSWTNVRTELGDGMVAFPGSAVTLYDYEAPNGSTVSYRARAFNSTYSTYSDWQSGSGGWSSASWWLKHNSKPSLNLELGIVRSVPGFEVAANQTVHKVLGSSRVVVVSDTAGPVTGSIVVLTEDTAERQALMNTLDLQVPMLLQAPVSSDEPERWVVFGDRSSTPLADKSWVHANDEVLPWTEVDRPSGALEE